MLFLFIHTQYYSCILCIIYYKQKIQLFFFWNTILIMELTSFEIGFFVLFNNNNCNGVHFSQSHFFPRVNIEIIQQFFSSVWCWMHQDLVHIVRQTFMCIFIIIFFLLRCFLFFIFCFPYTLWSDKCPYGEKKKSVIKPHSSEIGTVCFFIKICTTYWCTICLHYIKQYLPVRKY